MKRTFSSSSLAAMAVTVLLFAGSLTCGVHSQAISLACSQYDTKTTPVDINVTKADVTQPSVVTVDTGQWVYFSDDDVGKIVRFTGNNIRPTFENLGMSANFGFISGICLSHKDQSLLVVDKFNQSLVQIPCNRVEYPKNSKEGPYCGAYSNTFNVLYDKFVYPPSRCTADINGNVYVTQITDVILYNGTSKSIQTLSVPGSSALGPITVDLTDFDLYVGDTAQGKVFRLPCTQVNFANTECRKTSTTPTFPNFAGQSLKAVSGLALNRGDGEGDFDLLVSDPIVSQLIKVAHPKSSTGTATQLLKLPAAEAPADMALDPLRFDIVIAEPAFASPGHGTLARLPCADVVYAPAPSMGPFPSTTTHAPQSTTTTAPKQNGMSGGSAFILALFLVALIYFGGGALFLKLARQQCTIPNVMFWRNFGSLIIDGWFFVISCGKRRGTQGRAPVPYDGGKLDSTSKATTESIGQGGVDGPLYGNYDAMHDDL